MRVNHMHMLISLMLITLSVQETTGRSDLPELRLQSMSGEYCLNHEEINVRITNPTEEGFNVVCVAQRLSETGKWCDLAGSEKCKSYNSPTIQYDINSNSSINVSVVQKRLLIHPKEGRYRLACSYVTPEDLFKKKLEGLRTQINMIDASGEHKDAQSLREQLDEVDALIEKDGIQAPLMDSTSENTKTDPRSKVLEEVNRIHLDEIMDIAQVAYSDGFMITECSD